MPTTVKYSKPKEERYTVIQKGLTFDPSTSPPTPIYYTNVSSGSQGTTSQEVVNKSSVRTPNYHALIKSGQRLPVNPFSWTRRFTPVPSYVWTRSEPIHSGIFFQQQLGATRYLASEPNPEGLDWNYCLGLMNEKLLSRAKGNQWNAPIFMAEAKKTSDMVVGRAKDLVMIARAMKKGNLPEAFNRLKKALGTSRVPYSVSGATRRYNQQAHLDPKKAASNLWLETRYGWLPLMKDVQDAVETLQDTLESPKATVGRVKASVKFPERVRQPLRRYPTDFFGMALYLTRNEVRNAAVKAVWIFEVNPLDLPARFGLVNPLEVAWELVPFSFVADWFLPIGSYLSHLDGSFRFNHRSGSYGAKLEESLELIYSARYPLETFSTTPARSTYTEVGRAVMNVAPSLDINMLRFSNPFSSGVRVASSIALLSQQMRRF